MFIGHVLACDGNQTSPQGTVSKQKHEILFSRFQMNYNQVDQRYRKGSVLVREEVPFLILFCPFLSERLIGIRRRCSRAAGPFDIGGTAFRSKQEREEQGETTDENRLVAL